MRPLRFALALVGILSALVVPQAASGAVTKVYSSGELSEPIGPEIAPGLWLINTGSTITVPDAGTVVSVKVRVRLDHPSDGDLGISLSTPGAETPIVTLASLVGGSGDNFGSGPGCSGTFTTFDDAASTPISAGTAPFAETYKPEDPLSAFAGLPTNDDWRLLILDIVPGGTGRLLCWELELTYEAPPADLELRGTGPRTVKPGKRITYTLNLRNKGPGAATDVALVDRLPKGTTYVSGAAANGSCTASGRQVRCQLGDVPKDETQRVTIVARAPKKPGRITNRASVISPATDPVAGNSQVRMTTVVKR